MGHFQGWDLIPGSRAPYAVGAAKNEKKKNYYSYFLSLQLPWRVLKDHVHKFVRLPVLINCKSIEIYYFTCFTQKLRVIAFSFLFQKV